MTRGTTCQCRIARLRNGEPEVITEACELHGPGLPADALILSLPLKRNEDRWAEYEADAERITTPRAIFTHIPLDIPEVDDLYRGRYGNR